jgi:type I restriction enzyme M protein
MNGGAQGDTAFSKYMQSAMFLFPEENKQVLQKVVTGLDELYEHDLSGRDMQGDLYEYMLGKLSTAGVNGQFCTPKHIRDMMVRLVNPALDDLVCDIITTKTIQLNYPILKDS